VRSCQVPRARSWWWLMCSTDPHAAEVSWLPLRTVQVKLRCSSDLVKEALQRSSTKSCRASRLICGRPIDLLTNMQCGPCESRRPYCKASARASLAAVVAPSSPCTSRALCQYHSTLAHHVAYTCTSQCHAAGSEGHLAKRCML
jgi:hypothetical protein